MSMDWDQFRRADKSIDLCAAYAARPNPTTYNNVVNARAMVYLGQIEMMQPIVSRQAAAQAIATAECISVLEWLLVTPPQ